MKNREVEARKEYRSRSCQGKRSQQAARWVTEGAVPMWRHEEVWARSPRRSVAEAGREPQAEQSC